MPIVREEKAYTLVIEHEILVINSHSKEWGILRLCTRLPPL